MWGQLAHERPGTTTYIIVLSASTEVCRACFILLYTCIVCRKTYEEAVKELSLFMRHGYELAEKDLQSLLFDDTVEAFRHLDL